VPADRGPRRSLTPASVGLGCLLGEGYSNKTIAQLLGLSEAAVKSRISRALRQAGMWNRAQLVAAAVRLRYEMAPAEGADAPHACRLSSSCPYWRYCPEMSDADPPILPDLLQLPTAASDAPAPQPMTSREVEVARLAVEGLTCRQIGECLRASANTVKMHLRQVYRKLGVRSRVALVRLLVQAPEGTGNASKTSQNTPERVIDRPEAGRYGKGNNRQ